MRNALRHPYAYTIAHTSSCRSLLEATSVQDTFCCVTSTQHTPKEEIPGPRCSFDNVTGPFDPSRNHQIVLTWLPLEHEVHASQEDGCHGEPKPHPQGNNGCSTIRGWSVKMCNMGKDRHGRGWVYLLYLLVPRPMPQQWMDYITVGTPTSHKHIPCTNTHTYTHTPLSDVHITAFIRTVMHSTLH